MRKIKEFFIEYHHLIFWPVVAVLIFSPAFGLYKMFPAPDAQHLFAKSYGTDLLQRLFSSYGTISPDDLLKIILPPLFYHDFLYLFSAVLVSFGFYWFMRERGVTKPAAIFSAGAAAFAGYSFTLLSAGHVDYFNMWPYVVFTFAFLVRAVRKDSLSCYVFAACTATWAFKHGPDIAPQFLVVAAAYAFYLNVKVVQKNVSKSNWIHFSRGCAIALLVFALMAAPSIYNVCTNTLKGRQEQIAQSSGTPLANTSTDNVEAGAIVDQKSGTANQGEDEKAKMVDQKKKEEQWIFATNWSLPPEEFLEFVAPGIYGTWAGTYQNILQVSDMLQAQLQNKEIDFQRYQQAKRYYEQMIIDQGPTAPYWGRLGRSNGFSFRNPLYTGFFNHRQHLVYIGAMPLSFMIFAVLFFVMTSIRKQRKNVTGEISEETPLYVSDIPFWAAIWVISLLFAYGRYAPFYKLFYSIPYMSYLRAPVKFFRIVEFATMALAASGLAAITSERVDNKLRKGFGYGALAASAALVVYAMYINSSVNTFAADLGKLGMPQFMKPMALHAIHALWHGILGFAIVGSFVFAITKKRLSNCVIAVALSVPLAIDVGIATRPFMFTEDYSNVYKPNPVTVSINADVADPELGALMTIGAQPPKWFTDSIGVAGIRNLPFTDADNNGFLSRTGRDIISLCKVSAASHLLIPISHFRAFDRSAFEHITFVDIDDKNAREVKKPTQDDIQKRAIFELLRVRDRVPFCRLYRNWKYASDANLTDTVAANKDAANTVIIGKELAAPGGSVNGTMTAVLKSRSNVNGKFNTVIETDSPVDTICMTMHVVSPDLHAFVDGKPAEIISCGLAKCIGVHVPSGKHTVTIGRKMHYFTGIYSILLMIAFFTGVAFYWRRTRG